MTAAISRLAGSRRFVALGAAFLAFFYGWIWLPVLAAWMWPPFVSHSIEVTVADGVPVSVLERRDLHRSFAGAWQVRVIDLTRDEVRCYLPPQGVREQSYRVSETRAFEVSWQAYTGDAGACIARMIKAPGLYEIETLRTAWVWWRWVDLPPARSTLSFEVGAPPAAPLQED